VENVGRELSYRLGQSLSAIVRAVADGANSIDSSVSVKIAGGTSISLANIRSQVQSLAGRAVLPFNEQEALFAGVVHPFSVGDLLNDSSNNSAVDILKHFLTVVLVKPFLIDSNAEMPTRRKSRNVGTYSQVPMNCNTVRD